jgi:mRNA interferase MazF
VKRGEVWLCALDPTVGHEVQKTRPCVIVSPDELNGHSHTIIVAPLTSGSRPTRFRTGVTFKNTPGRILADQMRTLDRRRLIKCLGPIEERALSEALGILREMFTQ